ncbi:MAG TPA: type II toxin-antitoxin system VapB family antitoxin [Burkholderiaceae bacterium]|nr:type II toxin-antitoxin system VapB family antitoxin [Burkholderiaceae bacterium]
MKTTLEIDDDLLRRAKQAALERGTTLRAVVEEALSRALRAAPDHPIPLRTITWPPRIMRWLG